MANIGKQKKKMQKVLRIRAEKAAQSGNHKSDDELVQIYSNLGIIESAINNHEEACKHLEKAAEMYARKEKTMRTAFVLINLANVQLSRTLSENMNQLESPEHNTSLQNAKKNLEAYKQLIDSKEIIGNFPYSTYYNTMGIIDDISGKTNESLENFERAYQLVKESFTKASYFTGIILNNLGYCHLKRGDLDSGFDYLQNSLKNYKEVFGDGYKHPDCAVVIKNLRKLILALKHRINSVTTQKKVNFVAEKAEDGPNYLFTYLF